MRAISGSFARLRAFALVAAAVGTVAIAAGAGVASGPAGSGAGVARVRVGGDHTHTRVVIEMDRAAKGRLLSPTVASDAVVLALPGVDVERDLQGRGAGLVRDWAVDEAAGAARIRLNLAGGAEVTRRFLLPPGDGVPVYRYVMDLEARAAPGAATGAAPSATPTLAAPPIQLVQVPRRTRPRVVVIDAGHGGRDPGAAGATTREKYVTLAAAQTLKEKLERTGRYRVVLTRGGDFYIPLESRVSIARHADADLFISLHADSGPTPSVRGASVYTLSERGSDRAARKVMSRDDWFRDVALPGRDPTVNRILLDLTQRATKNRSAVFARNLLIHLDDRTALLQHSHRDAGFVVLLAPDVPAVLLEMGFITNPDDEAALTDPNRRAKLMGAVADAVNDYFESDGRYATVAAVP